MANLIECPSCNKPVSSHANSCPHCGETDLKPGHRTARGVCTAKLYNSNSRCYLYHTRAVEPCPWCGNDGTLERGGMGGSHFLTPGKAYYREVLCSYCEGRVRIVVVITNSVPDFRD